MTPDAREVWTCKSELKIMLFTAPSRAPFKRSTFHLIQHHSNYYLIFNSSSSTLAKLKLKLWLLKFWSHVLGVGAGGVFFLFYNPTPTHEHHWNKKQNKKHEPAFAEIHRCLYAVNREAWKIRLFFSRHTYGSASVWKFSLRNIKHKLHNNVSSIKCFGDEWAMLSSHHRTGIISVLLPL